MAKAKKKKATRKKKPAKINGKQVLYQFLQKTLYADDVWLFQLLVARLVKGLGIWFDPEYYRRYPIWLPFVVRDPKCRKHAGGVEEWGAPDANGYVRDDNTLIKDIPASLLVRSPSTIVYDGKKKGKGFVASHVWRLLSEDAAQGKYASRAAATNTFVANLVWLPSEVSKLSDREGLFTQQYLQALAMKIYKPIEVDARMRPFVAKAWKGLPAPTGIPDEGLPDASQLSFFEFDPKIIKSRRKTLETVIEALRCVAQGQKPAGEVVTGRYGDGLPNVSAAAAGKLSDELQGYARAVDKVNADIL